MLGMEGDHRRLFQRQVIVAHPRAGIRLAGEFGGVAVGLGPGDVVPVAAIHPDPAHLGRAVEPESDEKFV
jgi:hypothetical protein